MTRMIIFDTETTGFDPKEGHRIAEIGAVEMIDYHITGEEFHRYINPERPMPDAAFQVHGLSDEFLQDKPVFADIAQEFLEFIQDSILIAHNAEFDMNFLRHQLTEPDMPPLENEVIDTLARARAKFPNQKNDLDSLAARLGVSTAKREKHGALIDSYILAEVWVALCGKQQSNLLDTVAAETADTPEMPSTHPHSHYQGFVQKADDTERQAHQNMLKQLDENPLWLKAQKT